MRFARLIQPRYLIAIALAVGIIMVASALVELQQSRDELLHLMEEEASSLVETIDGGSVNVLLAMDLVEDLVYERLLDNARALAWLDSSSTLTKSDLVRFGERNNLYRINIFNTKGKKVLSNHTEQPNHARQDQRERTNILAPILSGKIEHLVIGLKEAPIGNEFRYAVAVRRARASGGAIVVNLNAEQFLQFRRKIGIGKLLRDLGNNSGIEYVVLQDESGIIAAGGSVEEMTTIEDDQFLQDAISRDTLISRISLFQQHRVFEVVKPLKVENELIGVYRIGVSMDELEATEARMQRRVWIMSFVLVVIAVLVVAGIVAAQNYRVVNQNYVAMQGLTGNILESMRDAVVTVDHQEKITIFNNQSEELLGLKESVVAGKRIGDLSGEARSCLIEIFRGDEIQRELVFRCADGQMKTLSVSVSDTGTTGDAGERRTAVIRDLTETRRLELAMQRKEKLSAMGELASGIAHEIRNPLNAISMIAQRFGREFVPKEGQAEYKDLTTVLRSETDRVNSIIQNFLRFARPPQPMFRSVSLDELVRPIVTLFRGQAEEKGVELKHTIDSESTLTVDPQLLTQALLNILQNALDATPAGGSISLTAKNENDRIRIDVRDTGEGIPPERISQIFNLYFTTKATGTGMGLAVTQQVVAQHGGNIDVQSEVGKGTIFSLMLPLIRPPYMNSPSAEGASSR
ncbi:MAG: ATP-binding protein [Bacteroidota bacterium]